MNNVKIPANGKITFTVDNEGSAEVVVPVVYQDANNDNHLSVDENQVATEAVAVGGQTGYYTGVAKFGKTNGVSPVGLAFKDLNAFIDKAGNLYNYDENDTFQVDGVDITIADFEVLLTEGDKLDVTYAPDGSSTFNFTTEVGSEAPKEVKVDKVEGKNVTLKWNRGNKGNIDNVGSVYKVERASVVGPDGVAGTPDDITGDYQWVEVGTTTKTKFTDTGIADGRYVYRVTVENPVTKVVSESPETATVDVPGDVKEAKAPRILQATAVDKGTTGEVDAGDVWNILFDKTMDLEKGDWIRVSEFTGEYSEIVLGEGNTFKTTTYPDGETLLTITFTDIPAIDGYNTFNVEPLRNNVLEYPLTITNSNGFDSKDGARLANNRVEFGDRTDLRNDAAPEVVDVKLGKDANVFVVTFDEAIDLASGNNKGNYKVTKGNGNTNEVTRVEVLSPTKVKVWTIDALGDGAQLAHKVSDVDGNKANEKNVKLQLRMKIMHLKLTLTSGPNNEAS